MSSTLHFDEDVILAKAAIVRACLETIRSLDSERYASLEEWIRRDLEIVNIQRAAQACLDLAHHLIAANAWELPRDAAHAMSILRQRKIIDSGLEARMRSAQGFRNIAVHRYTEIDTDILAAIVANHLDDFTRFSRAVIDATLTTDQPTGPEKKQP
jgi:uncharacterized protein YutE (UPF0331/DUF86 family)